MGRPSQVVEGSEAAGLVAKLADAADHAHGRGVIRRDIAPKAMQPDLMDDSIEFACQRPGGRVG